MLTPKHCCNCGSNKLVLEIAEGQEDATGLWVAADFETSAEFDEEIVRYRCLSCQRHFYLPV